MTRCWLPASVVIFKQKIDTKRAASAVVDSYESDLFSVRAAYTWRERYLSRNLSVGSRSYNDYTAQLDAAIVYHATDFLNITLEGVNLRFSWTILPMAISEYIQKPVRVTFWVLSFVSKSIISFS